MLDRASPAFGQGGRPIRSSSGDATGNTGEGTEAGVIPVDPDLGDAGAQGTRPGRGYSGYPVDPRMLAAVAAGGALGGPARFAISQALPAVSGSFPWATLWVNLSGSLILGFAVVFLIERLRPSRYLRAFLGTGFCGAYTTFSTFAVETDLLVRDGNYATAAAYVFVSVIAGLGAVYLGMTLARMLRAGRYPAPIARAHQ